MSKTVCRPVGPAMADTPPAIDFEEERAAAALTASSRDAASQLEKMRSALNEIDTMSTRSFGGIRAMATCALAYMKTPDAYRHPDVLAQIFGSIQAITDDAENFINATAGEFGCDHKDKDWFARMDARELARDKP
ncbi:hypothetical protein [Paucibacter sp. M5-1]|uniref:hypothetical protein n=1 Tax=Paucibacter sp. M5-1 TaxID=3015998 RepID=UPI0022B8C7E5|nr:hypothetical protein [Paucibacter sp. M5-1]MCZ7883792.1 hypothetical protein [Paucibacter sp. M5-1]